MTIKYKNKNGLNEKKSNQSAMNTGGFAVRDEFDETKFELDDQEKIENIAGEHGVTSGDSFDKFVNRPKLVRE